MRLRSPYPHRLLITRPTDAGEPVIYDGKADVQDAGAAIPRNTTGQPGTEATATAFLQDESAVGTIEQFDVATVFHPDGRVKVGEVEATRDLDGVVLLRLDEAGLTHTVILEQRVEERQPGARIIVTWVAQPEQPGRLRPIGGDFSIQADQPAAAGDYVLTLRSTATVTEGMRALVKGHVNDDRTKAVVWQRLVSITKVLPPTRMNDKRQSALAVDTDLNP